MNRIKKFISQAWIAVLIFYGWNILGMFMLIFLEVEFGVFSDLVYNCINGYTPWIYLLQVTAIFAIPIICSIVGIRWFHRKKGQLLRWFYGVEIPLLVLGIIRIVAVNDFSGHAFWFFLYLLSGVLVYAFSLLYPDRFKGRFESFFRVFFILIGLQVTVFLSLYVIPLLVILIKEIGIPDLPSIKDIITIGLMGITLFFFVLLSGTLFIMSPFVFVWMWIIENGKKLQTLLKSSPMLGLSGFAALLIAIWAVYPSEQSQVGAFASYEHFKQSDSNKELLDTEEELKEGLVNAYLWRYRYFDRIGKNKVNFLYKSAFGYNGEVFNQLHDFLLDAFMYHGNYEDKERASEIYQELFDAPIERAEKKSILYTLGSAFSPSNGEATLLSIDQKQVLVSDRDIQYKELGAGWVQVDFHERYLNQTSREQEVFYYFSLPESGVLTDMWLGNNDSLPKEFQAIIAPRGAAQAVYQEQRRRNRDPSLLEQVGPNQYRLRVFPIPSKPYISRRNKRTWEEPEEHKPAHLTLRMILKTDVSGHLTFPVLNEKRKVYWEDNVMPGQSEEDWFPKKSPEFTPYVKKAIFFDGWEAIPVSLDAISELGEPDSYVLCYDASYSMNKKIRELNEALASFPYQEKTPVYGFTNQGLLKSDWAPKNKEFIGAIDPFVAILALQEKHPNKHIVFITDQGSYELLKEESRPALSCSKPIDIVHLGEMAPIYEDVLNDAVLHSGGDVYLDMKTWLDWHRKLPKSKFAIRDQNQYWDIHPFLDDTLMPNSLVVAPVASRFVLASGRQLEMKPKQLDFLHELAATYHFVSPFSSMICLVNTEQEKRLAELSQGEDRFEREVETGKDTGKGFDMSATGVPEPEEWLMIILTAGVLIYLYRKRIQKILPWRA